MFFLPFLTLLKLSCIFLSMFLYLIIVYLYISKWYVVIWALKFYMQNIVHNLLQLAFIHFYTLRYIYIDTSKSGSFILIAL